MVVAADGAAACEELVGGGGAGCGRLLRKLMPLLSSANALMSAKTPGPGAIAAIDPAVGAADEVAFPAAIPPASPLPGGCVAATIAAGGTETAAATLPGAAATVATEGCETGTEGPPPPASCPLVVNGIDGSAAAAGDEALTPDAATVAASATGAGVASVPVNGVGFSPGKSAEAAVATSPSFLPTAAAAATAADATATAFSSEGGATPTGPGVGGPGDNFSAVAIPSLGPSCAGRGVGAGAAVVEALRGGMVAGSGAALLMSAFWHGAAGKVGTIGVGAGLAVAAVAAVASSAAATGS